jgi:hypothetical protein
MPENWGREGEVLGLLQEAFVLEKQLDLVTAVFGLIV